MAVLNWKDVDFNPVAVGQGGIAAASMFSTGVDSLRDSLKNYQTEQAKQAGVTGIGEAMKLTTAEQFRQAAKAGKLQINETNVDFFTNREKELLANEQAGVTTQGLKLDNDGKVILQEGWKIDNQGKLIDNKGKLILQEGYKIDNQGKVIDNQGKVIKNDQDLFDLNKDRYDLDFTKGQRAAQEQAAPIVAQISAEANSGTPEGRARANKLAIDNATLLVKAGTSLDGINGISPDINKKVKDGIITNETLYGAGKQAYANEQEAAGTKIFQDLYNNNSYVNANDAIAAIRNGPGTIEAKNKAIELINANKDVMYPSSDPRKSTIEQGIKEGATPTAPADPNGGALYNLIGATEGNKDPNKLFGNAEQPGGAFEGTEVSRLTISQLNDFATKGGYGDYVAGRNKGTTATPMGMYQIVNSTLQQAAKEMGLPPDTVFDADTQTKIFIHLADKRLSGPRTMQNKLDGMRQEWAGLKNVSDAALASAITAYENGDRSALTGVLDPSGQAAANDPKIIEQGLEAAAKSNQPLNSQMNQALYDQAQQRDAYATSLIQQMTLDKSFGGQQEAVLNSFLKPKESASTGDRADTIKAAWESAGKSPDPKTQGEDYDNFTTEVARIEKMGFTTDQAANLVKGATEETGWWEFWRQGDTATSRGKIDEYINSIFDMKETDPKKRIQGAVSKMQEIQQKATSASNLQTLQKDYQEAMVDYYSAAERKRAGGKADDKTALKRVLAYGKRMQAELDRVNAAASTRANIAATPGIGIAVPEEEPRTKPAWMQ